MKHSKLILGVAFLMVLCSCNRVNYIGESHEKTEYVQVFYDENKIDLDYEIIGHAVSSGDRTNNIRKRLIKRAMQEGADAILISGLGNVNRNAEASNVEVNASFLKFL